MVVFVGVSIHPRIQVALGFRPKWISQAAYKGFNPSSDPSCPRQPVLDMVRDVLGGFNPSSDPSCPRRNKHSRCPAWDFGFNPSSDPSCPRPCEENAQAIELLVSIHPRIQVALGHAHSRQSAVGKRFQSILGSKLPSATRIPANLRWECGFNPSSDPSCPRRVVRAVSFVSVPRFQSILGSKLPSAGSQIGIDAGILGFNPSSDPSCPRPYGGYILIKIYEIWGST